MKPKAVPFQEWAKKSDPGGRILVVEVVHTCLEPVLRVGDVVLADSRIKPRDGDYVVGYLPEYGDVAMQYKERGGRSWVECKDGKVEMDQCTLKGVIVHKTIKFSP